MAPNDTARAKALQTTQAVDSNAKKFSILAGTSIVQFLDQVVRNSTYIYDQQTKFYDPKTNELKAEGKPANITGWYKISMQAVPQGADRYDTKRNDYAYDITYRVEVYAINDAKSDFFPASQYRGTQKQYNYWFTGINTEILDYQQDFNYLYYIVQNAKSPDRTRTTTNHREVPRFVPQPRSDQSDQMNEGTVSEPSAQLADYLYSPGDTARVKLKILGDPAWIQQGDVRGGLLRGSQLYDAFLPDGTINYNGQEVLFEVLWNRPVDYDLDTGLMDPGVKNYNADRKAGRPGEAVQTNVYKAVTCTSIFSRGRFEQELEGVQVYFDLPGNRQQQTQTQERQTASKTAASTSRRPTNQTSSTNNIDPRTKTIESPSVSADTLRTDDFFPQSIQATEAPRLQRPSQPPTSTTQTVGPAASSQTAIRTLGGASGTAVGAPSTILTLRDGQTVPINSVQDIANYGGAASSNERLAAVRRLNQAQQAANSPTTTSRQQLIAKDS
jgi:hypothetical protein